MENFKNFLKSLFIFLTFCFTNQVLGKTESIGSVKSWKAFVSVIDKNKTCFLASVPEKSEGEYKRDNRGKTYVFVTNIKGVSSHEVSVVAGFNYKKNSEVLFSIDKKETKMFPIEDRAWSESSKTDRMLVKAMKRGKKLVVSGISSPGNLVKDTYSLSGFTKALSIIDKSCL